MNIPVLVLSMLLGVLLPFGHSYTFLIRPLLMVMLFLAFLEMKIDQQTIRWTHLLILLANIGIALGGYFLLVDWNQEVALTAFVVGIMPTAAAAPVLTGYLKGRVDYVTFSTLLTSIMIAAILPFLLPPLLSGSAEVTVSEVLVPVLTLMLGPLAVAWAIRLSSVRLRAWVLRFGRISFYCFIANVYLATSKASQYVRTQLDGRWELLLWIALISGALCLLNFELGRLLGGRDRRTEGSMALGRKNTMFAIWLALAFISPLAALGPMCYIFWQNAYNSVQLWKRGQKQRQDLRDVSE
jgi:bile acid:Na+ symporter, BASS family